MEDNLGHEEFLYRLLNDEVERREARQLDMLLRRAAFDGHKTLEDFDFSFNPRISKAKVIDLATCTFIGRQENIVLVGPAGVGRSHIAQAIVHRACREGYSTLCMPAHKQVGQLRAGRGASTYDRRLARFTNVNLLVIDDLGLHALKYDEPADLYEIIRLRHERGSTIITSNRDVQEWYPLIGDALLASAAMDRLLNHSQVLVMDGHSHRNPPVKRQAA